MGYCPKCGFKGSVPRRYCPRCNGTWISEEGDRVSWDRDGPDGTHRFRDDRSQGSSGGGFGPSPATFSGGVGHEDDAQKEPRRFSTVSMVIMVIIILLLATALGSFVYNRLSNPQSYRVYPEEAEFRLERTFTINPGSKYLVQYRLHSAAPKTFPGDEPVQDVIELDASPYPQTGLPDMSSGVPELMVWEGEGLRTVKQIVVEYHITTRLEVMELEDDDVGSFADYPQDVVDTYTQDEWMILDKYGAWVDANNNGMMDDYRINPTNTLMYEEARRVVGDEKNPLEMSRKIFQFMVNNFNYPESRGLSSAKSCLQTWQDQEGDCDDQSILYITLCRSLGIPARLELGQLYNPGDGSWQGHGWVNLLLPVYFDGEYQLVGTTVDLVNDQFLVRDPYRFTDWIDSGDGDDLESYYHFFSYTTSVDHGTTTSQDLITEDVVSLSFKTTGNHRIPL